MMLMRFPDATLHNLMPDAPQTVMRVLGWLTKKHQGVNFRPEPPRWRISWMLIINKTSAATGFNSKIV